MSNELVEREPVAQVGGSSPSDLIRYAMDKGADIEKLEQLFALQLKYEANEARKAYVAAMVEFKRNPPEIFKTSHVKFGLTEYDHATIGDVTSITGAALAACGISHRWDMVQAEGKITVKCILTHALGHSEQVELSAGADQSGGKNAIQAVASTVSYLQRYTLLAASGLATKDQADDDGRGGKQEEKHKPSITQARKKILGETAVAIVDLINKDDDFGAFGLCEPITDTDEKEYLWTLLPSNARSAIKIAADNKRKMGESARQPGEEE